jgi:hypothetical protein
MVQIALLQRMLFISSVIGSIEHFREERKNPHEHKNSEISKNAKIVSKCIPKWKKR